MPESDPREAAQGAENLVLMQITKLHDMSHILYISQRIFLPLSNLIHHEIICQKYGIDPVQGDSEITFGRIGYTL